MTPISLVNDTVIEAADQGNDTINSSITIASLAANVENLVLTGTGVINGTGNGFANTITGNGSANILSGGAGALIVDTLIGGSGNDTLVGGPGLGNDLLQGGAGRDLYKVGVGDVISGEDAGDTAPLRDSVEFTGVTGDSYTLVDNVEVITLMGSANTNAVGNSGFNIMNGNGGNNNLDGGAGANTLIGNGGNDTITGGAGIDTITGGLGRDTVMTGVGNDRVIFAAGSTDTKAAATATPTAGMDTYGDLNFSVDKLDLTVDVDSVGGTVTGTVTVGTTFITQMSDLLNVGGGNGFDTDTAGDITAAFVEAGAIDYLAVDVDHNGDFTAADFVIEITGFSGTLTDTTFV